MINIALRIIDFLEDFILASSIFSVICVITNVDCVILEKFVQWNFNVNFVIVHILNKHNGMEELC